MTAGFGAEIAAVLAKEAFFDLDAPIERLAMPDVPSPAQSRAARRSAAERRDDHRRAISSRWRKSDHGRPRGRVGPAE